MQFDKGHIFHIYNQGNNRQKIFFKKENYIFFLKKIQNHVLPFADILAWCLMPNHFHLMVYVNHIELPLSTVGVRTRLADAQNSHSDSFPRNTRTLNDSIGIMLRTYTRAVNNQENRTGALFREETKAICLTRITKITPGWYTSLGITSINIGSPEKQYPDICFNYILNNPVKDCLVNKPDEWEFSSYLDIIGLREGNIINRERIKELGLTYSLETTKT